MLAKRLTPDRVSVSIASQRLEIIIRWLAPAPTFCFCSQQSCFQGLFPVIISCMMFPDRASQAAVQHPAAFLWFSRLQDAIGTNSNESCLFALEWLGQLLQLASEEVPLHVWTAFNNPTPSLATCPHPDQVCLLEHVQRHLWPAGVQPACRPVRRGDSSREQVGAAIHQGGGPPQEGFLLGLLAPPGAAGSFSHQHCRPSTGSCVPYILAQVSHERCWVINGVHLGIWECIGRGYSFAQLECTRTVRDRGRQSALQQAGACTWRDSAHALTGTHALISTMQVCCSTRASADCVVRAGKPWTGTSWLLM